MPEKVSALTEGTYFSTIYGYAFFWSFSWKSSDALSQALLHALRPFAPISQTPQIPKSLISLHPPPDPCNKIYCYTPFFCVTCVTWFTE